MIQHDDACPRQSSSGAWSSRSRRRSCSLRRSPGSCCATTKRPLRRGLPRRIRRKSCGRAANRIRSGFWPDREPGGRRPEERFAAGCRRPRFRGRAATSCRSKFFSVRRPVHRHERRGAAVSGARSAARCAASPPDALVHGTLFGHSGHRARRSRILTGWTPGPCAVLLFRHAAAAAAWLLDGVPLFAGVFAICFAGRSSTAAADDARAFAAAQPRHALRRATTTADGRRSRATTRSVRSAPSSMRPRATSASASPMRRIAKKRCAGSSSARPKAWLCRSRRSRERLAGLDRLRRISTATPRRKCADALRDAHLLSMPGSQNLAAVAELRKVTRHVAARARGPARDRR